MNREQYLKRNEHRKRYKRRGIPAQDRHEYNRLYYLNVTLPKRREAQRKNRQRRAGTS